VFFSWPPVNTEVSKKKKKKKQNLIIRRYLREDKLLTSGLVTITFRGKLREDYMRGISALNSGT
jgi:hypothetical protein